MSRNDTTWSQRDPNRTYVFAVFWLTAFFVVLIFVPAPTRQYRAAVTIASNNVDEQLASTRHGTGAADPSMSLAQLLQSYLQNDQLAEHAITRVLADKQAEVTSVDIRQHSEKIASSLAVDVAQPDPSRDAITLSLVSASRELSLQSVQELSQELIRSLRQTHVDEAMAKELRWRRWQMVEAKHYERYARLQLETHLDQQQLSMDSDAAAGVDSNSGVSIDRTSAFPVAEPSEYELPIEPHDAPSETTNAGAAARQQLSQVSHTDDVDIAGGLRSQFESATAGVAEAELNLNAISERAVAEQKAPAIWDVGSLTVERLGVARAIYRVLFCGVFATLVAFVGLWVPRETGRRLSTRTVIMVCELALCLFIVFVVLALLCNADVTIDLILDPRALIAQTFSAG